MTVQTYFEFPCMQLNSSGLWSRMGRLAVYLLLGFVCAALGKHAESKVSSAEMANTINTLNIG